MPLTPLEHRINILRGVISDGQFSAPTKFITSVFFEDDVDLLAWCAINHLSITTKLSECGNSETIFHPYLTLPE